MFKIGDTVKLKSGGPLMTVQNLDGEDCYCVWFPSRSSEKASSGNFPAAALQAA